MSEPTSAGGRTGRRVGRPDTRAEILTAARALFAGRGYDQTSVRGVARAAGVDPALVHHYFGTKERLFLAVIQAPVDPERALAGVIARGPAGAGEHLVRTFLVLWDGERGEAFVGLLRSAVTSDEMAALMRMFLVARVLTPMLRSLGVPQGEVGRRAGLLASQLVGLAVMRYVVRLPQMADAAPEDLVASIGPTLQHYITGSLPPLRGRTVPAGT